MDVTDPPTFGSQPLNLPNGLDRLFGGRSVWQPVHRLQAPPPLAARQRGLKRPGIPSGRSLRAWGWGVRTTSGRSLGQWDWGARRLRRPVFGALGPEPMTSFSQRSVRVVRRRTATATQTLAGGPPPRLVIAPSLLCPIKVLAPRSTRHPLSNHPNKPRAPTGS